MKNVLSLGPQAEPIAPATRHTLSAPPRRGTAAKSPLPRLIDCRWCGAVVPAEEAECCEHCGWTIAYCQACAAAQPLGIITAPAPTPTEGPRKPGPKPAASSATHRVWAPRR